MLNTIKMSSSNIVMFLLPVVVTPILSRLYTPADFCEWGVFSSFVTILSIVLFAGYENTIVKATEAEIPYVSTLCLLTSLLISLLTTIVFYLGSKSGIPFFLHFPSIWLMAIYLVAYAIHTIFSNLCNRYGQYSGIAAESVILGSSQAGFRVLFGFIALTTINGLILGTTIAQVITMIFLLLYLIYIGKTGSLCALNPKKIKNIIFKYRDFALYDAPSSLLCFVGFNVPLLILVSYFNKTTIGCYSIILQLLLLPMSLIGSAIGRVYYELLCSAKPDEQTLNARLCTLQVGKVVALIAFLPMLFLACGGDKIVVLFLGAKWATAGNISLCLAFWSFPTILTQPLIPLFRYMNRQRILFLYNLAYAVVAVGTILLGCSMSHNIYHILTFYAFLCSLVNLAMYLHILQLGNVGIGSFKKYIPLWCLSSLVLIIRIVLI
ncbi:Membrane protein involved in the export of O-antigen and teichoic acid [Prevotella sp. KH2C16]|nr:Membrane protein involved in the export of O-antigen and teichoic acid [Prevotella sp. KH2C16]